jgi:uncharacterized protein YheU (UPF0270 family)
VEPIVVPHTELPAETLRAVIEAFVLREGTDYGARELSLAQKVEHVMQQLERGTARILSEPESQSIDITTSVPTRC